MRKPGRSCSALAVLLTLAACNGDGPKRMMLTAKGPGEVTAAQIETGHDIEVMNPDLVICTLDRGATLNMELTVETGMGYVPAALAKVGTALDVDIRGTLVPATVVRRPFYRRPGGARPG